MANSLIRPPRILLSGTAALALCCLAAGCATAPGVILTAGENSPVWPAPPLEPRIVALGQLAMSEDLLPGKSFWEKLTATVFGAKQPGALVTPHGLLVTGDQEMFVVDSAGRCIHRFGLSDRTYTCLPLREIAQAPVGVASDAQNRLYVTDPPSAAILVLDREGALIARITADEMLRPTGIVFSHDNSLLYVSDTAGHRVLAFDTAGQLRRKFGGRGGRPGELYYPTGLCVRDGKVYVCDSFNFRVQAFDLNGGFIGSFGEEGDRPGNFSLPNAVAVDAARRVWVLDARFENIQAFDSSGRLLMALGHEGTGPGQFWLPRALYIGPDNRMFVSDSYNRRVQVFQILPGDG